MSLPYATTKQVEKISREIAKEEIASIPPVSGGTKLYLHTITVNNTYYNLQRKTISASATPYTSFEDWYNDYKEIYNKDMPRDISISGNSTIQAGIISSYEIFEEAGSIYYRNYSNTALPPNFSWSYTNYIFVSDTVTEL